MTTYNTGNPVGSPDPRDLYDNAENLDNAANSDDATWTDRLGQSRRTMAGIEQDAIAAIQNAGYVGTGADNAIEDYAAGIEITQYNQIVRDTSGEFWRVSGSTALPYTLTGAGMPENGAFVNVGDGVLRQDLVQPVATFNNVADMKNSANLDVGRKARTLGYYTPGDGGGADYQIVAAGTGSNYGFLYEQLTDSGLEARLLGGGIMEDKTAYIPSNYTSIQDALDDLSKIIVSQGATITIMLESGFSPLGGVTINGGDYSRFSIESVDATVTVDGSFPSGSNLFGVFGAHGPKISAFFDMQGLGTDAFNLNSAATLVITNGAGAENAGRTGAFVFNGSTLDAADSIIRSSRGRNLWVSGAATANVQNADLTGGNIDYATTLFTGSVTSRRASVVNAHGADFSGNYDLAVYAIRASVINCNAAIFNNLQDSATALIAQTGAVISAKDAMFSNLSRVATAEIGGIIEIQDAVATNVSLRGLQATESSKIGASGASITAVGGDTDYGVNAVDGGEVNITGATIAGFNQPIRGFVGAKIYARGADLSSASIISSVGAFSQIWAHQSTTLNSASAGTPNVADFNVGSFNSIFDDGAVWA